MAQDNERLLSVEEAAYALSVTLEEMLDLIRQGKIKACEEEGQWKVRACDVLSHAIRSKEE